MNMTDRERIILALRLGGLLEAENSPDIGENYIVTAVGGYGNMQDIVFRFNNEGSLLMISEN